MLTTLAIAGDRSLRDLVVRLDTLNLVIGPNGSGKSTLYRALRLLAEIAQGRAIASLAREGGLQSTLWAAPEAFSRALRRGEQPVQGTTRRQPVSLRLGFGSDEFSYTIDLGLSAPPAGPFGGDHWGGKLAARSRRPDWAPAAALPPILALRAFWAFLAMKGRAHRQNRAYLSTPMRASFG